MSDDELTTQLRTALHAGVEDIDTPPTLLSGLRKSYTRRITARQTGVAVATAAVVGGSIAISSGPSPAPPQMAQLTAQITNALDAAGQDVVYVNSKNNMSQETQFHQIEHMWALADGTAFRDQTFHPDGTLSADFSTSDTGTTVSVLYDTRSYRTDRCTGTATCGVQPQPSPFTPTGITNLIATGNLTIVGTGEVINAQPTVHLRGQSDAISLTGTLDLWVSTTTHLPIHYTVTHASTEQDADVTYLPPTKQNLALLTAPIPAGFTQQH